MLLGASITRHITDSFNYQCLLNHVCIPNVILSIKPLGAVVVECKGSEHRIWSQLDLRSGSDPGSQ